MALRKVLAYLSIAAVAACASTAWANCTRPTGRVGAVVYAGVMVYRDGGISPNACD
jgi:hypothetical protein